MECLYVPIKFFLIIIPLCDLVVHRAVRTRSSDAVRVLTVNAARLRQYLDGVHDAAGGLFDRARCALLTDDCSGDVLKSCRALAETDGSLRSGACSSSIVACDCVAFRQGNVVLSSQDTCRDRDGFCPKTLRCRSISRRR